MFLLNFYYALILFFFTIIKQRIAEVNVKKLPRINSIAFFFNVF